MTTSELRPLLWPIVIIGGEEALARGSQPRRVVIPIQANTPAITNSTQLAQTGIELPGRLAAASRPLHSVDRK